jgi:hypothetical protein
MPALGRRRMEGHLSASSSVAASRTFAAAVNYLQRKEQCVQVFVGCSYNAQLAKACGNRTGLLF